MLELSPNAAAECRHGPAAFDRAIRVVGMARSGNHAIVNWMLDQLPGRWCFFNCIDPKSHPLDTARPLEDGRTCVCSCDQPGRVAGEPGTFLFSLEDTFLGPALDEAATCLQGLDRGPGGGGVDILILRDPYNLMASRHRFGWSWITTRTAQRIWVQHARTYLVGHRFTGRPLVTVNYNNWLTSPSYRHALADRLGLFFTDRMFDVTASCAGGSSFDGLDTPDAEKLLNRWRGYRDDPAFWSLINEDMADLADQIFDLPADPPASAGLPPAVEASPS